MGSLVEVSNARRTETNHTQPRPLPRESDAIRRILVCVDHSQFSESCLQHAVAISKSLGSAITLLYVMQPAVDRSVLHTTDAVEWEIARQEANAYLERLEKDGTRASGRQVGTRLEQGHPAERITAVARELDADLTVLGSHGERGVAAWNLGSTVLQVLAVTRGSVLIARPTSSATRDVSPKRILVPLDGSRRTESVLPTAMRIARENHAELLLALAVREPVATALLRAPEDFALAEELAGRVEVGAKRYLEDLRGQLVREGATSRTLVLRSTDDKQALLELSEESDLTIVSAHGSTCNPKVTFGSVTAHLLTHARASLLVLQDLCDSDLRGKTSDPPAPPLRKSYPEGV
jgi:nucleotide-binding universal stress UspA family protein